MLSELSGLFGLLQAPKDKQSGAEGALGDLLFDDVYKEVTPDSGLETSVEGDPAPPTEDPAATAATVGEEAPEAGRDEDGQSVVAPDKQDLQTGQLVERRFDADGIEAPQELPVDDVDAVAIEKPLTMNGPATAKPGDSPAGRGDPNSVTSLTQPVSVLPQSETVRDDMSDPVATVLRTEMPSADVPDRASAPTGANATLSLTASSLAPDVTRQPEIVADRLVMRQVKQKAGAVGALSGAQARARNEAVQSRISAGRGSEGVAPEPPGSMQQSVLRPTNATPGGPSRERIDVEVSGADWAPEASLRKRAAGQPVIAASHKHSQAVKNHEPILAGQISALPGAQVEGSSLMDSSASAVRMQAPLSDVQMAVGQGHPIWRSTLAIQRSAGRDPASPADQSRISPQGEMARSVGDPGNDAPNRPATSTSGMAITAYQVAVQGRPGVTDESVTPTKAETAGQRVPGRSVQRELPMESPPAQAIPSQGGARATTQRIPDKFLDVISKSTDEPDRSAIASSRRLAKALCPMRPKLRNSRR